MSRPPTAFSLSKDTDSCLWYVSGTCIRDAVRPSLLDEWDSFVEESIFESPGSSVVGHSRQKVEGRYTSG